MDNEIREMLVASLKDIYSAEKQGVRNMQRIVRKVTAPELREALTMHVEQTQSQVERVEQALEEMGARPGRKVCEAMRGLVEEAQHELEEYEKGPVLDIVTVAMVQTRACGSVKATCVDGARKLDSFGVRRVNGLVSLGMTVRL